jgi:hypothetical protein
MSLVTPEELSTFTQLAIPAGTVRAEAQAACDRATSLVRAYARRTITETTETVTVTLTSSMDYVVRGIVDRHLLDTILLPSTPVISVTSVTIGGVAVTGYTLRADGSILLPRGYPNGTTANVVYVSGYPSTDYRVQAARTIAVRIAARLWTNPDSRTSYTGPEALNFSSTPDLVRLLTADERAMLQPLVRMDVVG